MDFVCFMIGFGCLCWLIWKFIEEGKDKAWEEGFRAGMDMGTITIIHEQVKERRRKES